MKVSCLVVCKHCKRHIEPVSGFREKGTGDPRLYHLWKAHGIKHSGRLSDHFEKGKPSVKLVATTLVAYTPSAPSYSSIQTEQGTKYIVQKSAKSTEVKSE